MKKQNYLERNKIDPTLGTYIPLQRIKEIQS
jgi:hypothetical protein